MKESYLDIEPEIREALENQQPVVALETTLIAHGLPSPHNLECARALQQTVRDAGALPATIGICRGRIRIGLSEAELHHFATAKGIVKASRRDLATVIASGQYGATTVAATMICAAMAGIDVFATGGIGGVHRGGEGSMDISADLMELGRTGVTVVCSGAKSILDLPKTLEVLETQGVPVLGFETDQFPAFYVRDTGLKLDSRVDSAEQVALIIEARRQLGLEGGMVVTVPIPEKDAIEAAEVELWIATALAEARNARITGKDLTPFLLSHIARFSGGRTVGANVALVEHNAAVAAAIAKALSDRESAF